MGLLPDGYFFLHVLSFRLQSFIIPAEGNIIKPFIKGFSRQLLYKLLQHASCFVVAVGLDPHAKCFNIKTAFDPRKVRTFFFTFTVQNAQVHSQCLKTSRWQIKTQPSSLPFFLVLSHPSECKCGHSMPHIHKKSAHEYVVLKR